MDDRGDIVLGWLTKLAVTLGVLGVVGFDLVSLGASRFQAEDHAQAALRAANDTYRGGRDLQRAYESALAEAGKHGDRIAPTDFAVAPDGTLALTLHRTAPTVLVEKVAALRDWAEVTVTVRARPAS